MLIAPTLVIGIGSSGLEIADSIRELMVEEFLTPGLPVVRFMNISSHKGGENYFIKNDNYSQSYQRIDTAITSISPTLFDTVQLRLNPASNQYMKGLDEWFDRRLLNFDRTQLESGMANTRGLGRLALWLNWSNVTDVVKRNIQAIQNVSNKMDTNRFIHSYLNNPQLPADQPFVNGEMNVVIVGSLHGGTCSGSFLDLAYYIKEQYPLAKIFGHFTFMDNNLTQLPNNSRLSTNAYSALTEMDYLAAEGSSFKVQFPDTQIQREFESFPFTRVFLLSTTNTAGRRSALVTTNGIIKLENLHKLIALSVFFDIIGCKQEELEGVRINWADTYKSRLPQPPRHQKIFNSYGSLAFWYPKVRITSAAGCEFIQENFIKYWKNNKERQNRNRVQREVQNTYEELFPIIRDTISVFMDDLTGGPNTITAAKDKFINDAILELKKGSLNVSELLAKLNQEPKGKPFATRFKTNGYFYETITLQLDNARLKVVNFVKAKVDSLVREVFQSGFDIEVSPDYLSVTDLIDFGNQLKSRISKVTRQNIPAEDIDYSGCNILLDQIRTEQDRTLTALVFMRDEVLNQYFNRFSDEIRRIYNEAERLLLDHFVAKILRDSLPKIEEIIHESMNNLKQRVNELGNLADRELNGLLDLENFTTLRIITQTETVESDVRVLKARLTKEHASQILLSSREVLLDSASSPVKIFQALRSEAQKQLLLLDDVKDFKISNRLTENHYKDHAPDLYPLFEKAIIFMPNPYPSDQRPNLLAGGNSSIRETIQNVLGVDGDIGSFKITLDIDLNHLIYIYKEDSTIAFSEYEAHNGMKAQYDIFAKQNYGFHIDKNPTKFDVERLLNYKDMLEKKWFKITKDMFLSKIFEDQGVYLKFTFKDRNEIEYELFFKKDDEDAFHARMKDDVPAFEAFKSRYNAVFDRHDRQSFDTLIRKHRENLRFAGWDPTSAKFIEESSFYYNILNTRWP